MENYVTVDGLCEREITVERSRFIAVTAHVETEGEAAEFIAKKRAQFHDARHNVFAYSLKDGLTRFSDDGEPHGTAGKPILDVVVGSGVTDVCVVVTRYFGGVLLGTGGLVRAYTQAVKEGLNNCKKGVMCFGTRMSIKASYTDIGKIQYILGQENIPIENSLYTEDVEFTILFKETMEKELIKKITEGTNARAKISVIERLYFVDKEKSD